MKPIILLILSFLLLPCLSFAQKIEVEKRVPPDKAPASMQQFLQEHYPEKRKVKYYEERNASGRFLEAKFCFEKARYSVKFTLEGELVDVERQIKFKAIPEAVNAQIEEQLTEQFQRYKVVKTQEMLEDGQVVGYELVIRGKKENALGQFEGQFDAEGQQKSLQRIEQQPNDYLFF